MRPNWSSSCHGVAQMITMDTGARRVRMSLHSPSQVLSRNRSDSASSRDLKKSSPMMMCPPLPVMLPRTPTADISPADLLIAHWFIAFRSGSMVISGYSVLYAGDATICFTLRENVSDSSAEYDAMMISGWYSLRAPSANAGNARLISSDLPCRNGSRMHRNVLCPRLKSSTARVSLSPTAALWMPSSSGCGIHQTLFLNRRKHRRSRSCCTAVSVGMPITASLVTPGGARCLLSRLRGGIRCCGRPGSTAPASRPVHP